jgi:hypothetical protein
MNPRRWILRGLAVALVTGAVHGQSGDAPNRGAGADAARIAVPGDRADELPILQVHRYRMSGRIRPLLFWIGRDNVGIGKIVWRGAEGAVAYELLIGTDSAKAPRGINRWGYILEDTRPSGTRVLGVMTTSDEATLSDVTRRTEQKQQPGRFKGLSAHIASGVSRSATETIETEREFSVREDAVIVRRIEARLNDAALREITVPPDVRPGFLAAVAELVRDSVAAARDGRVALRRLEGRKIGYVYGRTLYHLEMTGVEFARSSSDANARGAPVHAEFETTNRNSGAHSAFELEYATDGPLAGVPTIIRYQPRWWLQAVLTLDDGAERPGG